MSALKTREDTTTGQLTLYTPVLPRLMSVGIGLIWIAAAIFFFLPFLLNDDQGDSGMFILFALFASFSVLASFFSALGDMTVFIDNASRTIAITKRWLMFPYSAQSISFSDVTGLELQHVRTNSRTLWSLFLVGQNNKRVVINWNGTESEMHALAEKISNLVGISVTNGKIQLPAALTQVLEKIAPNIQETIDEVQSDEPTVATPQIDATPVPADNTLSIPQSPSLVTTQAEIEQVFAQAAPTADLNMLSIQELEQRISADKMDSDAQYVLARKYHARGQLDKAIGLYQDTMRIDPRNVNAQNDLGVALQARGKRTEAEAAFRRAIALDPFSTIAHLNLALLLRSMNRAVEASQEFFQARQNARGDAETRLAESASTGAKVEFQLSKM
jgi:hypothetical protein